MKILGFVNLLKGLTNIEDENQKILSHKNVMFF